MVRLREIQVTDKPRDHPFRQAIMDEVHARPVDIVPETARVRRLVFVMPTEAGALGAALRRFAQFSAGKGYPVPEDESRQHSFETGSQAVTWEFHTEFVTITWRSMAGGDAVWPDDIGIKVLSDGLLIGAMRIDVIAEDVVPARLLPGFELQSLCVSDIEGRQAQVATDFVADEQSFTRFEFAAGRLSTLRRSILVRRLLEVETYRTMALMGLPLARQASPDLRAAETELTALIGTLADITTIDQAQAALTALNSLSVRSGQISERLDYRFAASQAYGNILRARLAGLKEESTSLGSSLSSYLTNRVEPALATCLAIEKRLDVLSDKIERAIGLLDVRIELDVQVQNKAVLETIARTGHSQFQLQRTVEGLSTIAISYYLLGILSYVLAGPLEELHFDKTLALSVAAPFVLLFVWLMVRRVRNAHAA